MIALFSIAAALAADDEVSFEIGWIGAHDHAWEVFSRAGAYTTFGLRVGKEVHPRVALVAGWQHGNTGAEVEAGDDTYSATAPDTSFRTAFYGDQVTLGAKADVELLAWLHPYATVQGLGARAMVRFDDDPDDDENLTQIQRVGLSGGVYAAGGLDLPIRVKGDVAIAPYLELGYGLIAPIHLGDVGQIGFSGFAGRAGAGVRF